MDHSTLVENARKPFDPAIANGFANGIPQIGLEDDEERRQHLPSPAGLNEVRLPLCLAPSKLPN